MSQAAPSPSPLPSQPEGAFQPLDLNQLLEKVGGRLGAAESVVPVIAFLFLSTLSGQNLRLAGGAAILSSLLFLGWRLARREQVQYAVNGLIGVGLCVLLAGRSGQAENFFLPGLVSNGFMLLASLLSLQLRWPLIGVLVSGLTTKNSKWRAHPPSLRAASKATWVWAGVYGARLLVQLPLYLSGSLLALGAARLAMGIPLTLLALWLSWRYLSRASSASGAEEPPRSPAPAPAV